MRRLFLIAPLLVVFFAVGGLLPAANADDPGTPVAPQAPAETTAPVPSPAQDKADSGDLAGGIEQTVPAKPKEDSTDKDKAEDAKTKQEPNQGSKTSKRAGDSGFFGIGAVTVTEEIIGEYDIPATVIPVVESAAAKYSIPPEYLFAILKIESYFCSNQGPSSANAVGCYQFLPSTWKTYGTDANEDKVSDPAHIVDSAFAAARYLTAAGFHEDVDKAIFAYNHSTEYVADVKRLARHYARRRLITHKIGSLMAIFPVQADGANYDNLGQPYVEINAPQESPVVAVTDGTIKALDTNSDGSKRVVISDVWGNDYVYQNLASLAEAVPNPKSEKIDREQLKKQFQADVGKDLPKPQGPATDGQLAAAKPGATDPQALQPADSSAAPVVPKERLHANYEREGARKSAIELGQAGSVLTGSEARSYYRTGIAKEISQLSSDKFKLVAPEVGTTVLAGSRLGTTGANLHFEVRPADLGDRAINPKPLLDQWKKLEELKLYRATGYSALIEQEEGRLTPGQVLLMSKPQLEQLVLLHPAIKIYDGGREDIKDGKIDSNVLRWIAYLSAKGLHPTVTSLMSGHGKYVANSDRVSNHYPGRAVDFSAFNDESVLGNQKPGSYTAQAIRYLMGLPEPNQPTELISLIDFDGPSFAAGDHDDHLHAGIRSGQNRGRLQLAAFSKKNSKFGPKRWRRIVQAMAKTTAPPVPTKPSRWATKPAKKKTQR